MTTFANPSALSLSPASPLIAALAGPELVSALADGELSSQQLDALLRADDTDSLMSQWSAHHRVRDALQGVDTGRASKDSVFLARFNQALQHSSPKQFELALPSAAATLDALPAAVGQIPVRPPAANDAAFRWKLAAGFAGLVAVSSLSWALLGSSGLATPGVGQTLASSSPAAASPLVSGQVVVASPQGPLVRDVQLEAWLAAHKQMGGQSALMEPSGFLRNASADSPSGARR